MVKSVNYSLLLSLLISFPKTVYFNFRVFPFHIARKLPILINRRIKLGSLKGRITLPSHFHPAMVKIGFSGSYNLGGGGYFSNDGEITFNGKATFSKGIQLITNREGKIIFGNQFRCNSNCIINSGERILFADDVLLSWNVTIIDGDGHRILPEVEDRPNRISVGKHVWICANVTILKGTSIQNNVVVSSNAIVSKKLRENNVIIGGVNQIIKRDINWEV